MENVTPEQKQPIIKSLAVAGLVAVIIFISWLAIQIVHVFPAAASSLASLANSVYNYNPTKESTIELSSSQTMITNGESFVLSWKEPRANGTYAFTYGCTDGATVDLKTSDATFVDITCDAAYDLGNTTTTELIITTTKHRFTEVPYTIEFFKTNATTPTGTHTGSVTVVNANLFADATAATTTTEIITTEVATSTETAAAPETATSTEVVPVEVKPIVPVTEETKPAPAVDTTPVATAPIITEPEYIYEIPVSQKDGSADLLVSFIGIGIVDSNGAYIKTDTLAQGNPGALQISVHNIGNKTSEDWVLTATLPGDLEFSSAEQKPLLPNERSLITLAFKEVNDRTIQTYSAQVTTTADKNTANNSITGSVIVTPRP